MMGSKAKVRILTNLAFLPKRKPLESLANDDGRFATWNALKKEIKQWQDSAGVSSILIKRERGALQQLIKPYLLELKPKRYYIQEVDKGYYDSADLRLFYEQSATPTRKGSCYQLLW